MYLARGSLVVVGDSWYPLGAYWTSFPTIIALSDATVGQLFGTTVVFSCAMETFSYGRPSASAAIWQSTVLVPWPNSALETSTRTFPSAFMSTPTREFR